MRAGLCVLFLASVLPAACGEETPSPERPDGPDRAALALVDATCVPQFCARIVKWEQGPRVSEGDFDRNAFVMEIVDEHGALPASFSLGDVVPFMKIHGHGVPRAFAPKLSVDGNRVRVTELGFIMAGPWQIVVSATVNGRSGKLEIPVEVP